MSRYVRPAQVIIIIIIDIFKVALTVKTTARTTVKRLHWVAVSAQFYTSAVASYIKYYNNNDRLTAFDPGQPG